MRTVTPSPNISKTSRLSPGRGLYESSRQVQDRWDLSTDVGHFDASVAYPVDMAFERITTDPARMRGLPCIRGTRITVSAILGQLAAGRSIDDVLADYPQLEREDVLAALEYAAAYTNEREIALPASG